MTDNLTDDLTAGQKAQCSTVGPAAFPTDLSSPDEKVSLVANTWIKQMHFRKAGDRNCGHKHAFDHQTLLAKGRFRVRVEDRVAEFAAPTIVFVAAGKEHLIEALEDDSVAYCIHAVRNGTKVEDIMNPDDIPEGKWFGDETHPLVAGAKSERYYRITPVPMDTA
jgi:quercetin dioxygenase-like cupin family protein